MNTNDQGEGRAAPGRRNNLLAGTPLVAACLLSASVTAGLAQGTTGVPGSPSATTTIDEKYLPPQPPNFGGQINLESATSTPYWPPKIAPPVKLLPLKAAEEKLLRQKIQETKNKAQ